MKSAQAPIPGSVPARPKRRLGAGGCLLILGCLLALMILIPTVAYLMWTRATAKRVESQLAELRARAQPTTAQELDDYYVYPPEREDVTALLLAAIRELDTPAFRAAAEGLPIVGTSEREIPPPGQAWEDLDAARALLDQYAESLGQLHEAADKGGAARFPVKFDDGLAMLLEHAQQLRNAARLLALQTHVRAHEGDAAGAARSIRSLLSLARSLENEPVLISQLVGYACHATAYGLIDDLLSHVEFADEDLAMLQRELRRGEIAQGVRHAMVGERVFGIDAMRHPEKLGEFEDLGGIPTFLGPRHEDLSLYIATMNRFIEAAEQPWPEAQKRAGQARQDFEATVGGSPVKRMRYMMSSLMLPALEAVLAAGARTDAARGVVDAAIAAERYRHEHGQPPQTLEDLVPKYLPAVAVDPFDGQPLRYLVKDDQIVVYSIGRDEVDNGGQGDLSGEPDVVVRLPRP